MPSALSPRDIQTRIRSGASLEELARESEVPVDRIEPFAAPVLAEREHVAGTALQCPVRRRGETGSVRAMRAVVSEKLAGRSIDIDDVEWDSWRNEDRRWTVVGRYTAGDEQHEALFLFDQRARFSVATNDQARWLIGEHTSIPGPAPLGTMDSPDAEPTIDLSDELALVRAIQGAGDEETAPRPTGTATTPPPNQTAETATEQPIAVHDAPEPASSAADPAGRPVIREVVAEREHVVLQQVPATRPDEPAADEPEVEDYAPAELEQVDGVYDIVPTNTNDMDVLYDMLSSFAEDSVNIYAGLTNPVAPTGDEEQSLDSDDAQGNPASGGLHLVPGPSSIDMAADADLTTVDDEPTGRGADVPTPIVEVQGAPQVEESASRAMDDWAAEIQGRQADESQAEGHSPAEQGVHEAGAEPVVTALEDAEVSAPPHHSPSSVAAHVRSNDGLAQRRRDTHQGVAVEAGTASVRIQEEPSSPSMAESETTTDPTPLSAEEERQDEPGVTPVDGGTAIDNDLPTPADIAARAAAVDSEGAVLPNPAEAFLPPQVSTTAAAEKASDDESPSPEAAADMPAAVGTVKDRPAADETVVPDAPTSVVEAPATDEPADASADPAPAPVQNKPKPRPKKKRASVPSWDEIMFGGPTPGTR